MAAAQAGIRGEVSPPAVKNRELGNPKKTWLLENYQSRDAREARTIARQTGKLSPYPRLTAPWPDSHVCGDRRETCGEGGNP